MNKLILSGRLPKDGVIRYTPNGSPILEFALAAESGRGEYKKTSWVKCKLLGKRAETLQQYLKKGLYVIVSGEIHLAKWEHQGKQVSGMELVVDDFDFGGNSKGYTNQDAQQAAPSAPSNPQWQPAMPPRDDFEDDDIPF